MAGSCRPIAGGVSQRATIADVARAITNRDELAVKRRNTRQHGTIAFERSYRTALQKHVRAPTRPGAGERIGRRALKLGVGTLTLARIHQRAAGLDGHTAASIARQDSFFAEAVAPMEQAHCGALEALVESKRLAAELRSRTDELAAARSSLAALHEKLGTSERQHGELLARSRLMEQRMRRLSHKLLSVQEEERLRISRDLHDAIGQTLTGINVGLATLKQEAAADSHELAQAISRAQQLVERSMKTVHQFAWELRPTLLDDLGLVPALRSYAKSFAERTGIRVRFAADATFDRLDADRSTALFRVAQGALSNVERHARAAHAQLNLSSLPGAVRLEVRDGGRSFDVGRMETSKASKHLGLLVMRERMEMVGGSFSITSSPKDGTTVRADVPLEAVAGD